MLEERLANLTEKSEETGSRAEELEAAHSVLVDKVGALEDLSAHQEALIDELRESIRQKVWKFGIAACSAMCFIHLSCCSFMTCLLQCVVWCMSAAVCWVSTYVHEQHAGTMLSAGQRFASDQRRIPELIEEIHVGVHSMANPSPMCRIFHS